MDYSTSLLLDPSNLEDVVIIQCLARSGSFFLSSLLDGHPHLLTLPVQAYSMIHEDLIRLSHAEMPIESRVEQVANALDKLVFFFHNPEFARAYPLGDSSEIVPYIGEGGDELIGVDRDLFKAHIQSAFDARSSCGKAFDFKYLIQVIFIAFRVTCGVPIPTPNPTLIYSIHTHDRGLLSHFYGQFPQTRCLTAVRSFPHAVDSQIHRSYRKKTFEPRQIFGVLEEMFNVMDKEIFPSRAVSFENLHLKTESTMERVAKWIGIPYDSILTKTTSSGKLFYFNSVNSGLKCNPSKDLKLSSPTKTLSVLDRFRIRFAFQDASRKWGYGNIPFASSFFFLITAWIPFKPFYVFAYTCIRDIHPTHTFLEKLKQAKVILCDYWKNQNSLIRMVLKERASPRKINDLLS